MLKVKIFGAGSIGNHLANAARQLGWEVSVCDVDEAALARMKNEIYPQRYGVWDEGIKLYSNETAPKGEFDLICIGTPPDYHLPLALAALEEVPRAILVEKPLCPPDMDLAQELHQGSVHKGVAVFVGYDHVVGRAAQAAAQTVLDGQLGQTHTLDVEFREHWEGIYEAHPWLSGPQDTYLGFWRRGGGASGEHSHALNLWQYFAHLVGAGKVIQVSSMLTYKQDGVAEYDDICLWNLLTEKGIVGRVVQDVVTRPPRKIVRLHGENGCLEWVNGYNSEGDAVVWQDKSGLEEVQLFPKKRPDDFIQELQHIAAVLQDGGDSPICLERGLETMLAVAAAHHSQARERNVKIDYSKGFVLDALS